MALARKHAFVSQIPDSSDATLVRPSNWNAAFVLTGAVSGGIPYFKSSTSEDTSAVLASGQIVLGGGAGNAPATLGSNGATGQMVRAVTSAAPTFSTTIWPDTIGNFGGILHQAFGSDNVDVRSSLLFNGSTLQVAADAVASDMVIRVEHVGSGVGTGRAMFLAKGQASGGDAIITWTLDTLQSWTAGGDQSDSGNWKLSAGTALGTGDVIKMTAAGVMTLQNKIFPGNDAGTAQSASGLYAGTGVPNNSNGADGDYYFRSDAGIGTHIYFRSGGTWGAVI